MRVAWIQWQADKENRRIVVTAPPDLQVRLRQLSREIWPENGPLQRLLPAAVEAVRQELVCRRDGFDRQMRTHLVRQLAELARLKSRQLERLELALARSEQAQVFEGHRRAERSQEINQIFDDYQRWVADTLTTERYPYIQVVGAVTSSR